MRISWPDRLSLANGPQQKTAHGLFLAMGCFLSLVLFIGQFATAQESEEAPKTKSSKAAAKKSSTSTKKKSGGTRKGTATRKSSGTSDGPGVIGRVGFLGGKTVGRDDSIVPVEIMPYLLFDPHFVFGDVRLFATTEGHWGGNFGGGYRYLDDPRGAWYGVNAFVDVDQTSGEVFSQLGLGLEAAWKHFEARSNFYLPVGDRFKTIEDSPVNARYSGNQILFDQMTVYGNSLAGLDGEIGTSWDFEPFDHELILRGFVGGYHFAADKGDPVTGVRTRGEAVIDSSIILQLEFTSDDEYGQNLIAGITLEFPWGGSHPGDRWRRNTPSPFRMVQRNYNIILDRDKLLLNDIVAVNPTTGQPYFVQHVNTNAGSGGDGTFENPFTTFAPTAAEDSDIILVHAGSVLNESIFVDEGTRVLGEGTTHFYQAAGIGRLQLPSSGSSGAAPIIQGVNGTAVTLADNTEFSGFTLQNIVGTGIQGDGLSNTTLRSLIFNNIDGDAVVLSDSVEGTLTLTNLTMTNVDGRGVALSNTDADVVAGGWNFDTISGAGLVFDGGTGDLTVSGTTTIKGTGTEVVIRDTEGTVAFERLDVIGNGNGPLLTIQNAAEDVTIGTLVLENANGDGLLASDVEKLTIGTGVIDVTDGYALDLSDSDLSVVLREVNVDGGPFGVRLTDVTGATYLKGGTINETDVAVQATNAGSVVLEYMKLTDNELGVQTRDNDLVVVSGLAITGTTSYAIDSTNDALVSIKNSDFDDNGDLDGATIRIAADDDGLYRSELSGLQLIDERGTGILFTTLPGGEGATLATIVSGSLFTGTRSGQSGIKVLWEGDADVTISNNDFLMAGSNMTALNIQQLSATDELGLTVYNNEIGLDSSNSTGLYVLAEGTSELEISSNAVTFGQSGGKGFVFDFQEVTNTWITSNIIKDTAGGATGMLFQDVARLSKLQIENNLIDLTSASSSVDKGMIFDSVESEIQLLGNYDNKILGATDTFYIPSNTSTGRIYINGVAVP